MTLAQFESLEERRAIEIRHARFNAGLVTSALLNRNRGENTDPVSPFDFLSGYETDPEELEAEKLRKSIIRSIKVGLSMFHSATPEAVQAEKYKMIARLQDNGVDDAEQLFREAFPDL